jgi:hemoglobin
MTAVNPDPQATDYERIGGGPAVGAVVDELYRRLVADEQVSHYFDEVSLPELKRHQALMITTILGGPDRYDGRSLGEAHAPLAISDPDYDRVGLHLMSCLEDAGVPVDIQVRVGAALGQVRGAIVSQSN